MTIPSEDTKVRLEFRDNKGVCVCVGCEAWYHLDAPICFKHNRKCPYKKVNTAPIDERFTAWQYNVVDKYKGLSTEEIKERLISEKLPFAVVMENWQGDFNLATVIRNANAMGAEKVFYLSTKKGYDRRGTVGTHNYTDVIFLSSIEELIALKSQYKVFVGVDNVPGSVPIESYQWQSGSLMIFGEEGPGLTQPVIELCDNVVEIAMRGSVRSLNAGVASGITMFDFANKYAKR